MYSDKRLSEDEGEGSDDNEENKWRSSKQRDQYFFYSRE
jgi:hypothetical protein